MKDLLKTSALSPADVALLLDLADGHRRDPRRSRSLLAGDTVVLYFNKPSTRTRISFETAVARLGGVPIATGPADLQLGRGETIEDTARVISSYARAFVIRTFADADVERFATTATIPVINALTDGHHPCQSLADLLTLRDRFGSLRGLRVAYLGDGNNVAHSLMEACALAGVEIVVATPRAYAPDPGIVGRAAAAASANGGRVRVTDDAASAVEGAHAVYTDTWVSMGNADAERAERLRVLAPYRVDQALMARARPEAVFLHCLPAHRGEEVTAEVMDGPQSMVLPQAANRLPTAIAVLEALVSGLLGGVGADRHHVAQLAGV